MYLPTGKQYCLKSSAFVRNVELTFYESRMRSSNGNILCLYLTLHTLAALQCEHNIITVLEFHRLCVNI